MDDIRSITKNLKAIGETRRRHIKELRELAKDHDAATQIYNHERIASTATSGAGWALGAIGSTAAIITTIGTGGLAAPLWALGLGIAGMLLLLSLSLSVLSSSSSPPADSQHLFAII